MRLFIDRVRRDGDPQTLRAYSEGRPPLTEQVAIAEAATLARATGCPVNLLHLSSAAALDAARAARAAAPGGDLRTEVTLHHLCLDHESLDAAGRGLGAKVNPPVRTRADNEALWAGVVDGTVDWVASDHACCMEENKGDALWPALPGFGGTALLYPVLLSEGHHRRGIPLRRITELASAGPAAAYGLARKGSLMVGSDADLVVVDLDETRTVSSRPAALGTGPLSLRRRRTPRLAQCHGGRRPDRLPGRPCRRNAVGPVPAEVRAWGPRPEPIRARPRIAHALTCRRCPTRPASGTVSAGWRAPAPGAARSSRRRHPT